MIGLNFDFSFTPKWSLAIKVSDDVSASVLQTSINSRYALTNNIGLLIGMTYFDAVVKIEDDSEITDISYV